MVLKLFECTEHLELLKNVYVNNSKNVKKSNLVSRLVAPIFRTVSTVKKHS